MKYDALIALVLSGCSVSRELADLAIAGEAPVAAAPHAPVFSRPAVPGELESLIAAQLDAEAGTYTSALI